MGVDLGMMSDYTAIAIIQEALVRKAKPTMGDIVIGHEGAVTWERVWQCVHLERPDLGTPYEKVVETIRQLLDTPQLKGQCDLVIDATGLGRPVAEMMRSRGLQPISVVLTGGTDISQDETGAFKVPKAEVVDSLRAWYAMHRFKVASAMTLAPLLEKELSTFVPKVTKANNVTYEALRQGDHDDLVLAASFAIWWGSYTRPWSVRHDILDDKQSPSYSPFSYLEEV